ncbi:hypothetical protein SOM61_17815 [Massilia sp. CFBP9012]|uniref:hypothetical protein n=1 Tax=Massilia sp. CFBP9012 TaxID=3096531 RepID=UPI002A6A77D6|nr:hypothetical protein [Massilia sp. CFBP9012]MDY0976825.1 hypothetical protein [Massilia sp. CFBP9012]
MRDQHALAEDEIQNNEHDSRNTQQPANEILTHDELLSDAYCRWVHDAGHEQHGQLGTAHPKEIDFALVSNAQDAHARDGGAPGIFMQGYTESSLVAMQKSWLNIIGTMLRAISSHHFYRG